MNTDRRLNINQPSGEKVGDSVKGSPSISFNQKKPSIRTSGSKKSKTSPKNGGPSSTITNRSNRSNRTDIQGNPTTLPLIPEDLRVHKMLSPRDTTPVKINGETINSTNELLTIDGLPRSTIDTTVKNIGKNLPTLNKEELEKTFQQAVQLIPPDLTNVSLIGNDSQDQHIKALSPTSSISEDNSVTPLKGNEINQGIFSDKTSVRSRQSNGEKYININLAEQNRKFHRSLNRDGRSHGVEKQSSISHHRSSRDRRSNRDRSSNRDGRSHGVEKQSSISHHRSSRDRSSNRDGRSHGVEKQSISSHHRSNRDRSSNRDGRSHGVEKQSISSHHRSNRDRSSNRDGRSHGVEKQSSISHHRSSRDRSSNRDGRSHGVEKQSISSHHRSNRDRSSNRDGRSHGVEKQSSISHHRSSRDRSSNRDRRLHHKSSRERRLHHKSSRERRSHHKSSRERRSHHKSNRDRRLHHKSSRDRRLHHKLSRERQSYHSSSRDRQSYHSSSRDRRSHGMEQQSSLSQHNTRSVRNLDIQSSRSYGINPQHSLSHHNSSGNRRSYSMERQSSSLSSDLSSYSSDLSSYSSDLSSYNSDLSSYNSDLSSYNSYHDRKYNRTTKNRYQDYNGPQKVPKVQNFEDVNFDYSIIPDMPKYDDMTEQQKVALHSDFRSKFGILRMFYPEFKIPDYDDDIPLFKKHITYERILRTVNANYNAKMYLRQILIVSWMAIEFVGVKFLKMDFRGYTMSQLETMDQYQRMLIELGEKHSIAVGSSSWSIEVRIFVMSIINCVVFVGMKYLSRYAGPQIADSIKEKFINPGKKMASTFLGSEPTNNSTPNTEDLQDPPPKPQDNSFIDNLLPFATSFINNMSTDKKVPDPKKKSRLRKPVFSE